MNGALLSVAIPLGEGSQGGNLEHLQHNPQQKALCQTARMDQQALGGICG